MKGKKRSILGNEKEASGWIIVKKFLFPPSKQAQRNSVGSRCSEFGPESFALTTVPTVIS